MRAVCAAYSLLSDDLVSFRRSVEQQHLSLRRGGGTHIAGRCGSTAGSAEQHPRHRGLRRVLCRLIAVRTGGRRGTRRSEHRHLAGCICVLGRADRLGRHGGDGWMSCEQRGQARTATDCAKISENIATGTVSV